MRRPGMGGRQRRPHRAWRAGRGTPVKGKRTHRPGDGTDSARPGKQAGAVPGGAFRRPTAIIATGHGTVRAAHAVAPGLLTYTAITLSSDAVTQQVRAQVRNSAALEAQAIADPDGRYSHVGRIGFAKGRALITALGNGNPHPQPAGAARRVAADPDTATRGSRPWQFSTRRGG